MGEALPQARPTEAVPAPMARALSLAQAALFITSPNPRVGCVITAPDGRVLGEGHTQAAGSAHAEIMALADAQARGHDVRGSTVWVTLEPCAHQGRTGPCADALVAAGVARVVASAQDPNPLVSSQGFARLAAAGIAVEVGLGQAQTRALNPGFFNRMERGLPWVRMKIAASLDGQTALSNGQSQWITGPGARADGHAFRARACAVLTGVGTVRQDDPTLSVRLVQTPRQPHLVVVDSRWETPTHAQLWQATQPARQLHIYGAVSDPARESALAAQGAALYHHPNAEGKVDLRAMLEHLAQTLAINELHVEAGHQLNGSFLQAGLVDELLLYLAPKMLGAGWPMARLGPYTDLSQALEWQWSECTSIGSDLRLRALRANPA